MIVHIEHEVLAHDGEAYQPYVAASAHLRLLIFTDCDSHYAGAGGVKLGLRQRYRIIVP
jgi:hypothetical protein